ncbi:hypothetical protein [Neobacillus jeddahensis]|uniref:hypothetical protein n=1 Tax=Neobacillus jeddahensis TaxID=1461580 RepID=UPI00058ADF89|nr:hypothetical protein [Neobacillus jeddahensis]
MLVKYAEKERPRIILERHYDDVLPLLEMVKQKATVNVFMDSNGDRVIHGRLYYYEYTLATDSSEEIF